MSSSHVAELVGSFHLGALDDPEYDQVEAHLAECPSCLRDYLVLKRRVDRSAPLQERPSAQVRLAIRQQVSRRLPAALGPRRRLLAMGAAVAAAVLLALLLARQIPSTSHASPSPLIDSATPSPLL